MRYGHFARRLVMIFSLLAALFGVAICLPSVAQTADTKRPQQWVVWRAEKSVRSTVRKEGITRRPVPAGTRTGTVNRQKQNWVISFELAFGAGSPYSSTFPDLYSLPYGTSEAITQEVLRKMVRIVIAETGAQEVKLLFGPGGWRDYPVVPSAQLEIRSTPEVAQDVADSLGFLAQQTEVITSRTSAYGNKQALQILERQPGRQMADVNFVQRYWKRLRELEPVLLQGFQPVQESGQVGIRIIDTEGGWRAADYPRFKTVTDRLSLEFHVPVTFEKLAIYYSTTGNNWESEPQGSSYLRRISARGNSRLGIRMNTVYAQRVKTWVGQAFARQQTAPQPITSARAQGHMPKCQYAFLP